DQLFGKFDDENRVFGGKPDEHDQADLHIDCHLPTLALRRRAGLLEPPSESVSLASAACPQTIQSLSPDNRPETCRRTSCRSLTAAALSSTAAITKSAEINHDKCDHLVHPLPVR